MWVLLHTEPLVVPVVAWADSGVSPAIVAAATGLVVLHQETTQATVVVPVAHHFTVQALAWEPIPAPTLVVGQATARSHVPQG